jgi:capsular exopolysaccharide synthesis family protein
MPAETLPRSELVPYQALHLRDYWHVLVRRRWLAFFVFTVVVLGAAVRLALTRPVYQSTAQVLIERDVPNVLDFEKNARAADVWDSFYQTQYRLLQSRLLARRVVDRLNLQDDPEFGGPRPEGERSPTPTDAAPGTSLALERVIDQFLDRLRVQPVKNSQLVAVSFQAQRPVLAADVVNAVVDAYIQQTLQFRYRVSAEAGAWLVNETQEQSKKVESAALALQKFQEQEGLANVEERRELLDQKLKDLGGSLNAAKTRRLEKEAVYQAMSGGNVEELPDVLRSPLIQTLRTELATLERQGAVLEAKGYLQEHPEAVRLRSQIEGTRQKIAIEARRIVRAAQNEYQVALSQEGGVAAALEAAKAEAQDLSRRSVKYDALKRDLEASKTLSDNILTRQKQTDVARDLQASNVHVIDPAIVPRSPLRPQPLRDLALAALFGLGCGIAAAFFRDYLDTSVGRPSDVRLMGLPLLGVIPETHSRQTPALIGELGREPFAEGYRVLRTALHPARPVESGHLLLVTSALPGEGKTLTALNLALSLAQTEERVLLVDADLRRPSLHTLLPTRRVPGLSDVLTGSADALQAVQRVPGTRLNLLACGAPAPMSTTDLLASGALRELFDTLRRAYDRIVVDTPPAGTIADALVLAPLADGVLVVARSGKVARSAVLHVLDRIFNAGGNVMGVVLNRARPDRNRYDYGPPATVEPFRRPAPKRLPPTTQSTRPSNLRRSS